MRPLTIREEGTGTPVVFVHGGAGPKSTWTGLNALSERWRLMFVYRRGFGTSPATIGRGQDFQVDAEDLSRIFQAHHPHVVAHSYGVLGTLFAAASAPDTVRSLTLIEPPLYFLAPDDRDIARLERVGDAVLTHGPDTDPAILREFLTLSGAPNAGHDSASDAAVRRAWHGRLPGEAHPDLAPLRATPTLIASGGHSPALEKISDLLAESLAAERLIAPGAGHFVAAAPGFADRLDRFLTTATSGLS
ncbi:alpha/beta fold hydrolase [Nocardia jejuensis]|uniref:alpha/beta fold hydrolase n=1 Tax=Nocardia jejuensis TaxID=328049 RepID=UPI00082B5C4A|nr:alpha/beta hydrolase [Nocardia jejuensis]